MVLRGCNTFVIPTKISIPIVKLNLGFFFFTFHNILHIFASCVIYARKMSSFEYLKVFHRLNIFNSRPYLYLLIHKCEYISKTVNARNFVNRS